ncbi:glycerophosphodiester phosphodiesterase [Pedococcus cremeus]|uniref:glycerophosphodiester phosphodiesterase n=1 Tax=Pedococcus cremeus TaxID=587636 RepID=UPI001FDF29AF|nr:glycerophosphodiester phosphodiesterase [Pedococcus cremeus]
MNRARVVTALVAGALVLSACTDGRRDLPAAPASSSTSGSARPGSSAHALVARPLVIGHRGAAGYRPEHTLASYELGARMGADFIEPDLVSTKDHVLVARHENEISGTTDVAEHPEFADRKTTKTIDGKAVTGWFTEDFTLAELRTLRAVERLPDVRPANRAYDGRWQVPTFAEILALRARLSKELGRTVGVVPELKHPTYFRTVGLPLEPVLVAQVRKAGLDSATGGLMVQCFEPTTLKALDTTFRLKAPLLLLTQPKGAPFDLASSGDRRSYRDLLTPTSLRSLAKYVNVLGPDKAQVIGRRPDGTLGAATTLVSDAHAVGLEVMPYTFRAENQYLPSNLQVGAGAHDKGRAAQEQEAFLAAGVDGLFSDQPDVTVKARAEFMSRPSS